MSVITAFFEAQAKASAARHAPSPIECIALPAAPERSRANYIVAFPLPTPATELQCFLQDFQCLKGIDVISSVATLTAATIGPGLLTHLSVTHMMELTGLLEGHALLMQVFGRKWSMSLEHQRTTDVFN
jgi:hypothetical protein